MKKTLLILILSASILFAYDTTETAIHLKDTIITKSIGNKFDIITLILPSILAALSILITLVAVHLTNKHHSLTTQHKIDVETERKFIDEIKLCQIKIFESIRSLYQFSFQFENHIKKQNDLMDDIKPEIISSDSCDLKPNDINNIRHSILSEKRELTLKLNDLNNEIRHWTNRILLMELNSDEISSKIDVLNTLYDAYGQYIVINTINNEDVKNILNTYRQKKLLINIDDNNILFNYVINDKSSDLMYSLNNIIHQSQNKISTITERQDNNFIKWIKKMRIKDNANN